MAEVSITNEDLAYLQQTNPQAYNRHIAANGTTATGYGTGKDSAGYQEFGVKADEPFLEINGSQYSYGQVYQMLIDAGYDSVSAKQAMMKEDIQAVAEDALAKTDAMEKERIINGYYNETQTNQRAKENNDKLAAHYSNSNYLASIVNQRAKNDNSKLESHYGGTNNSAQNNDGLKNGINTGSWKDIQMSNGQKQAASNNTGGLGKTINAITNPLANVAKDNAYKDYSGTI